MENAKVSRRGMEYLINVLCVTQKPLEFVKAKCCTRMESICLTVNWNYVLILSGISLNFFFLFIYFFFFFPCVRFEFIIVSLIQNFVLLAFDDKSWDPLFFFFSFFLFFSRDAHRTYMYLYFTRQWIISHQPYIFFSCNSFCIFFCCCCVSVWRFLQNYQQFKGL